MSRIERKPPPPQTDFMIGWICVLDVEYIAATSILDEEFDVDDIVRGHGDRNGYTLGRVGEHNVMINIPPADTYGQTHSSRIANDMKSTFPQIRCVLLVGIGGGIPSDAHDIRLGDVVLGTRVVPYDIGRNADSRLEQTGLIRVPPRELLDVVTLLSRRRWSGEFNLSDAIERTYASTGQRRNTPLRPKKDRLYKKSLTHSGSDCDCLEPESLQPDRLCRRKDREGDLVEVFKGAIGSGNQVMKNATDRDAYAKKERLLCYEMEAIGVMETIHCLPIRGISDYADGHKNNEWQLYAAMAAALCGREFLRCISPRIVAHFPLTLFGEALDRYIRGAVKYPSTFPADEIKQLRQTRDSLMERHAVLRELEVTELRTLRSENASRDDIEDARANVKKFEGLRATLKTALEDLDHIIQNYDHSHSYHDPVVRTEIKKLEHQVKQDHKAMDDLSEIAQGGLKTTGTLLQGVSNNLGNPGVGIAASALNASSEFLGHGVRLWQAWKDNFDGYIGGKRDSSSRTSSNPPMPPPKRPAVSKESLLTRIKGGFPFKKANSLPVDEDSEQLATNDPLGPPTPLAFSDSSTIRDPSPPNSRYSTSRTRPLHQEQLQDELAERFRSVYSPQPTRTIPTESRSESRDSSNSDRLALPRPSISKNTTSSSVLPSTSTSTPPPVQSPVPPLVLPHHVPPSVPPLDTQFPTQKPGKLSPEQTRLFGKTINGSGSSPRGRPSRPK